MTFRDSNWLITFTIFPQPHFLEQPPAEKIWWGWGLYPYRIGNFIKKPMLSAAAQRFLMRFCRTSTSQKTPKESLVHRYVSLAYCRMRAVLPAGNARFPFF